MSTLGSLRRDWRIHSELAWIIVGQALVAVGALAGVRLLTQLLSPVSYGRLMLALTMVTLISQLTFGPLAMGFARYFSTALECNTLPAFFAACRLLTLAACGGSTCAVGIGWLIAAGASQPGWSRLAFLAGLTALAGGCTALLDAIQNAARQRAIVSLHQGAAQWLKFGLGAIAVTVTTATTEAVLCGYLMASLTVLLSQYGCLLKWPPGGPARHPPRAGSAPPGWGRRIVGYSWPFAAWGSFAWMQSAAPRWALETCVATEDVGKYAALSMIGFYPMQMLAGTAVQLLSPVIFARYGDGADPLRVASSLRLLERIVIAVALAAAGGMLTTVFLNDWIFQLLVGPQFRGVSHYLPILVADSGLFAIAQLYSLGAMAMHRSSALLYPKILSAGIGVIGSFICARQWGLSGVVFSSLIVQTIALVWYAIIYSNLKRSRSSIDM